MTTIVLADDHIMLRNGLAALVKTQGYNVLYEAANGKELIEKLDRDNLPDIVLMDLNMPEMDGYETTRYLRSRHPTIKVLALSMYDHESAIIRILKCGAKGYILKELLKKKDFITLNW
jgi:two-component system, NarL family, invasion response regulator UvrY